MSGHWFERDTLRVFFAGAACALLSSYLLRKALATSSLKHFFHSKTVNKLETANQLDREVEFYFGEDTDRSTLKEGLLSGPEFTKKCALLCEQHTAVLKDFTGESGDPLCLVVGCSVGSAAFELSESFPYVLGIDPSQKLISIAEQLQDSRKYEYISTTRESAPPTVLLDPNLELEGVSFKVADPCALPSSLAPVDCVLAANVLCRLHTPKHFLKSLSRLLKANGTIVLVSSYIWNEEITSPSSAIQGYIDKEGNFVLPEKELIDFMTSLGFHLTHHENLNVLRKQNIREYEIQIAHVTVWLKTSER